jgi:hypothetical protein
VPLSVPLSIPRMIARSALGLAVTLGVACGPDPDPLYAKLTFGITSDDGGLFKAIHVTTTVDGAPATDETLMVTPGPMFPHETTPDVTDPAKEIGIRIEAYPGDPTFGTPILVRTARAHVTLGSHKLLRIQLEQRCIPPAPGGVGGPTCTLPNQTCIAGSCADDAAPGYEDYNPNWPTELPDLCRPANPGPPVVTVGTGQTDYLPITDGETVQAEKGPQGGHHVYVAVRMHNLKQSGSTTTITGTQPGTGVQIPPTAFVFTFDQDEGGYCKLYGLRYQLDNGGIDYTQFLGKPLDIQVVIKDSLGEVGTGIAHINVAPTILGGP